MENIKLLFDKNDVSKIRIKINKGKLVLRNNDIIFSGNTITSIIKFINALHKQYPGLKIPIQLYLGRIEFIDKLSYVFLECICYILIVHFKQEVQIFASVKKQIGTEGAFSSPLLLLNSGKIENIRKFEDKFKNDIYGFHLRRLINGDDRKNTNYLGELYTEIDCFLKPFGVDDECRDEISKVIIELVGNACEHGNTDCLMDIDVSGDYYNNDESIKENYYYGINIVVINFSDILIGDGIKRKIELQVDYDERYKTVYKAYEYHKTMFCNNYWEEDFYNITAFQHKISGRELYELTGGTGLTQLIMSLENRSSAYRCYMISGKRAINFLQNTIEYNEEKWIGFNTFKDYENYIPALGVISDSLTYMPGTAFNLNFVMKGKKINGE